MDSLLVSNGLIGLYLAWAACRESRRNRRDARLLGAAAGVALTISAATWLHVLDQGW